MELIERIPLERINAVDAMSYPTFKAMCTKCKNEPERKEYFAQFKRYTNAMQKSKGEMKRLYTYTEATPTKVGGRLFCPNSIQGIAVTIRGYLLDGVCTDIDMKNAHPVILSHICHEHNIPSPCLDYYIANRDSILAQLGEGAKIAFLKSVNTDTMNRTMTDPFFKKFDREMKELHKAIAALPDFDEVAETVPFAKVYNWTGSFINRVLCIYENRILQKMVKVLTKKGIEIMSLMFDGLMVYGNFYNDKALLAELELVTAKYGIKLAYKPHSAELSLADVAEGAEEVEETDQSSAEAVFKKFPNWKYCKGGFYVFDETVGMWSTDIVLIQQLVGKYGGAYTSSIVRCNNVISKLKTLSIDNDWLRLNEKSGLGKILFKNGFYDSVTKKLEPFNPAVVFFGRIGFDYEPTVEPEPTETDDESTEEPDEQSDPDDIAKRFFYLPLGENVGKYMLGLFARALMGKRMKRILFGLGEADAGKSVTVSAIQLAFQDYVGTFNAANLAFSKSSADEAAKLRWALALQNKRLIFSNEIQSTESIDGNMLKKLASESDTLVGRNHGGAETDFLPDFLAVIMANDTPKIKPFDDAVNNRLRIVSYNKHFVDTPTEPDELQKDCSVLEEIRTLDFQQKLVNLVIKFYHLPLVEPEEVMNAKKEWVEETANPLESFLGFYEVSNNPIDFVTTTDVQNFMKDTGISMMKFGKALKKHCDTNGFDKYVNKSKKIDGKVVQCYFGIRERHE